MKALSFTQPWLWAILHGGKRIENRVWKGCAYRGPILLHAAKGVGTRAEFDDTAESILTILDKTDGTGLVLERFRDRCLEIHHASRTAVSGPVGSYWGPRAALQRGGIVGRARIVGVVRNEKSFADYLKLGGDDRQRAWWFGGFALELADVESLPFTPWKGALGLFEVPDDYASPVDPSLVEEL